MNGPPDLKRRSPQLWGQVERTKQHPFHSMCSYLGAFPPQLVRYFLKSFTEPGDIVMDPFAGRGTTHVEALELGRVPYSSDLNPLAVALTSAKNAVVTIESVLNRIDELEDRFDLALYLPEATAQASDIQLIYHPHTLARLCFLRRMLVGSSEVVDQFLVGVVLGIMHGSERNDGTSAYASISMPNTFSMSPNYVRRFVQDRRLQRKDRDVFKLLREKTNRLLRRGPPVTHRGVIERIDARHVASHPRLRDVVGKANLVLTSPPYLNIVNYGKQNWIRLWFLNEEPDQVSANLDDKLPLGPWLDFMEEVVLELKKMLSSGGVIVLVIGDVARSRSGVLSPARELLRLIHHGGHFSYIGAVSDYLDAGGKTTRVWKDTRGQATTVDRVVILANSSPEFRETGKSGAFIDKETAAIHAAEFAGLRLT